jgi:hypothetical protein
MWGPRRLQSYGPPRPVTKITSPYILPLEHKLIPNKCAMLHNIQILLCSNRESTCVSSRAHISSSVSVHWPYVYTCIVTCEFTLYLIEAFVVI